MSLPPTVDPSVDHENRTVKFGTSLYREIRYERGKAYGAEALEKLVRQYGMPSSEAQMLTDEKMVYFLGVKWRMIVPPPEEDSPKEPEGE